jgi:aminopeptidase N
MLRKAFERLPSALRPVRYVLRLKPDLQNLTFEGWMCAELRVAADTSRLVCNAAELEVTDLRVDDEAVPRERIAMDGDAETMTVRACLLVTKVSH